MTTMAHKLEYKQKWPKAMNTENGKEVIHSGHFMVSNFEAEAQDDEDELAVPVPEVEEAVAEVKSVVAVCPSSIRASAVTVPFNSLGLPYSQILIETSLTKLFQCMSLAYRQKLTSPKWNRFKGIRLRWKDKIRLNNVIWRCWHMQFIKKQNTLVCQFASPLDADTHNKPEAVVLEGKYWKRKLNAVTAEYKKWRMYSRNQVQGRSPSYGQDPLADFDGQDWSLNSADSLMMVDEDYMGLMSDTLFSTITANQPFAFPDPREIARGTNLADFIQPSLVQLQPNLDDFMDIEPLQDLFGSKLVSVPEETQIQPQYPEKEILRQEVQNFSNPPFPPPYPTQNLWFSNYNEGIQQAQIIPQNFSQPSSPPVAEVVVPRKEYAYTPPKTKAKWRRNDQAKKMATVSTAVSLTPLTRANSSPVLTPLAPVNSLPSTSIIQETPQNNTFLAQLLTNTPPTSYNFIPEPTTSPKPIIPKEDVFSSQNFSNMNSLTYKSESDYSNQTYQISQSASGKTPVQTSNTMIIKSIKPTMTMPSSSVGPDSPDQVSLSPINVGSPTSPSSCGKPPPFRDHRRVCHTNAEQKRRCNIKNGFDTLHSLIPHLNQNPNAKMSKAAMLQKGAEYIRQLQTERNQLQQEMESLKQEIESLNAEICNCQSMLPATGAPISKHRSNKMKDMYRKYVRARTHENWKFWILSLICEPLLESFTNNVATSSLDDLYRTTIQWVNQHCSLVNLRPIALNALRQLSTMTEVLKDPAKLPHEAIANVDRAVKRS